MRRRSGLTHEAIDIGGPRGTPVISTTAGTVVNQWMTKKTRERRIGCGWTEAGGFIVMVMDSLGFAHYYAHLDREPEVRSASAIVAGQRLGVMGNSGTLAAGGPVHLHYQVWSIGAERATERATATFGRPFGQAVNPYSELVRVALPLRALVNRNGGVTIPA